MPGITDPPSPGTTGPDNSMTNDSNGGDDESSSNRAVENGELHSLSSLISPDDWRLYHIMRELRGEDRARLLAFAEMLYNMQRAKRWAETEE
jgi:hypothetical protein